jgi:glycosyltransferase involved in cell wall biosynthesis
LKQHPARAELRRRRAVFEKFKRRGLTAEARCRFDDALFWLIAAATTAWMHPFGLWVDAEVEAALSRIARSLPKRHVGLKPEALVVQTSFLIDGGGHAELILMTLEEAEGREKAVVSSEWLDSHSLGPGVLDSLPCPSSLCLRHLSPSRKVVWLYARLCELAPAKVILNTAPNDLIGVTALAMYKETGAEVLYYDQADCSFWVGTTLADRVLAWRDFGVSAAVTLRGIEPDSIRLVRPCASERRSPPVDRSTLGVPEGATLSLTVGNYPKFRPDGHFDYAETLGRLLDEYPNHYHVIVGHGPGERELKARLSNNRVVWLGLRRDVDALLAVSDFVIESFPLMGGLFRHDAMKAARPVVAVSHPAWPEAFDTDAFGDYPFVAASNEEVLAHCRALIDDDALRTATGEALRRRYEALFSREGFSSALNEALLGGGARAEPGRDFLPYDAARFSTLMSPGPVGEDSCLMQVKEALAYAPRPGVLDRVAAWKRRARESVRYRLGY